jgi:hypothetical protein
MDTIPPARHRGQRAAGAHRALGKRDRDHAGATVKADTGTVTYILLTKPFKGRTGLGIRLGSPQEKLIAAYGH